ncbi:MAG: hypothetical protein H0U60_13270 [Blastocatellia bacterium]|nr:hypothetical protein [Blastocatellia bacterium]
MSDLSQTELLATYTRLEEMRAVLQQLVSQQEQLTTEIHRAEGRAALLRELLAADQPAEAALETRLEKLEARQKQAPTAPREIPVFEQTCVSGDGGGPRLNAAAAHRWPE